MKPIDSSMSIHVYIIRLYSMFYYYKHMRICRIECILHFKYLRIHAYVFNSSHNRFRRLARLCLELVSHDHQIQGRNLDLWSQSDAINKTELSSDIKDKLSADEVLCMNELIETIRQNANRLTNTEEQRELLIKAFDRPKQNQTFTYVYPEPVDANESLSDNSSPTSIPLSQDSSDE